MAMHDLEKYPLKLCLFKYEWDIHVFLFIFIFCLLLLSNNGEIHRNKHFLSLKNHIFDQIKVSMVPL